MTAFMIGSSMLNTYSQIESGKAQQRAMEAEARQVEADAKTQLIDRKRALLETMAQQNVGAAAQGRTISSISALQSEDMRRAKRDETIITSGAAGKAGALRDAGKQAKRQGYLSAGSSLMSSGYKASQIGG